MIQGRKIGNSPQLEFTALVDAAEAESLGLLQKQKKKRRKEMVQLIALGRPSARLQLNDWLSLSTRSHGLRLPGRKSKLPLHCVGPSF